MGKMFGFTFGRLLMASLGIALALPATASQVTYYHTDALGSVVMESNEAGQVVYQREHRPYGEPTLDPPKDGPGYTGHVMDVATGLTYMQQRYYDPQIGRFLSVDPVGAVDNAGGNFNRYKYANSNPYRFTDPDGRLEWEVPQWLSNLMVGKPSEDPLRGQMQQAFVSEFKSEVDAEIRTAPQQAKRAAEVTLTAFMIGGGPEVAMAGLEARGLYTLADAALNSGKISGAASEYWVGNRSFRAVSGEVVPHNPDVTAALMGTPNAQRAAWHGGCAEIACLDKAFNAGASRGGTMRTINIGVSGAGHGTPKPFCSTCSDILEFFGIGAGK